MITVVVLYQEVLAGDLPGISYGWNNGVDLSISSAERGSRSVGQQGPNVANSGPEANSGVRVNSENKQSAIVDAATTISDIISTLKRVLPTVIQAVTSHEGHYEGSKLTDLSENNDLLQNHTSVSTPVTGLESLHIITEKIKDLEQAGIIGTPIIRAAENMARDLINVANSDEFCVVCNITDVFERVYNVIAGKLKDLEQADIADLTEIIMTLHDAANSGIKIINSYDFRKLASDIRNIVVGEFMDLEQTGLTDLSKVKAILQDAGNIGSKIINFVNNGDFHEPATHIINVTPGEFKNIEQAANIDQTKVTTILQDAASVGSKMNSAINTYVHKITSIITNNFILVYNAVPDEIKDIIFG
jgi:hypothetical protein